MFVCVEGYIPNNDLDWSFFSVNSENVGRDCCQRVFFCIV